MSLWAHILVPLSLGTLVARITKEEVRTWYSRLKKPAWTPPPPVFGIVWPLLYVLMGTASWMLFRSPASHLRTVALGFYIAGLLGNLSYQIIFMKAHALKTSCASVAMQLVFTVGCALASLAMILFFFGSSSPSISRWLSLSRTQISRLRRQRRRRPCPRRAGTQAPRLLCVRLSARLSRRKRSRR